MPLSCTTSASAKRFWKDSGSSLECELMPTRLQISPRYCWWAFVGERSKPVPRRGVRSVPPTNEVVNQEAETELRGKLSQPLSETLNQNRIRLDPRRLRSRPPTGLQQVFYWRPRSS